MNELVTRAAVAALAVALLSGCATQDRFASFTAREGFDPAAALLGWPDQFPRFRVPDAATPLRDAEVADDEKLIVVERAGARRALRVSDLAYHHIAQGELAGEPYVVAF